jgi:predicted AlkP superfamily phosphohydrolase/phosphomutase
VVLIGLDGVSPNNLRPWMDGGELPTFQTFAEKGCFGTLQSTVPTMTPPGWVSLATGKNPGQHGVFGFTDPRKPNDFRIVSSRDVRDKRIWDVIGDNGKCSCVVNVPVTYPPEAINGIMVGGFLTPAGSPYTHPPDLQEELENMGYAIDITAEKGGFANAIGWFFRGAQSEDGDGQVPLDPSSPDSVYSKETEILDTQIRALLLMAEKRDWDFIMYVARGTDVIQHFYWHRQDVVLSFMKAVDGHLSRLMFELEKDRRTDFFVVSDHGFDAAPKYGFNTGLWAVRKIYAPPLRLGVSLRAKALARWGSIPLVRLALDAFGGMLQRISPAAIAPWIGVALNADQEVDSLIEGLLRLRTPEGTSVFSAVERREMLYSGRNLERAPDLVWLPGLECVPTGGFGPELLTPIEYPTPGAHWGSRDGLVMAIGPDVKKGGCPSARIQDVAPTVYALLSVPIPEDLDGEVIGQIFPQGSSLLRSIRAGPPATKEDTSSRSKVEDDSEVRARLRALGYVE